MYRSDFADYEDRVERERVEAEEKRVRVQKEQPRQAEEERNDSKQKKRLAQRLNELFEKRKGNSQDCDRVKQPRELSESEPKRRKSDYRNGKKSRKPYESSVMNSANKKRKHEKL